MGRIDGGQMVIAGITKSSPEGGSVIDVSPSGNLIAVATYALRLRDRPASIADVWLSPDLARLSSNSVHKRPFTFVPIRVAEDRQCKGMYLLLDGHMRIQAMRELGATEVNCIVSTDDQGFTYNKRVNRLASPAASMVVRAQARETQ